MAGRRAGTPAPARVTDYTCLFAASCKRKWKVLRVLTQILGRTVLPELTWRTGTLNGLLARRVARVPRIRVEAHCPGRLGTSAQRGVNVLARRITEQSVMHQAVVERGATSPPSAGRVVHAWTELGAGGRGMAADCF